MVKCVVSGCPNREGATSVTRGVFSRPTKRFFKFPKDPARVKVWLAALRETDKQDSTERHLICEDHFLPEDISTNGVNSDAIPIMPPYLDGPMGMISPWGAESSEDEEDQWAPGGGCDDEDDDDDDDADDGGEEIGPPHVEPPAPEPPAPETSVQEPPAPDVPAPEAKAPKPLAPKPSAVDPPQQDSGVKKTSEAKPAWASVPLSPPRAMRARAEVSLGLLTQRFLDLLLVAPDSSVDIRQVTERLQTRRRRVYDISNVLEGISLLEKQSANRLKWIGSTPISHFLSKNREKFQRELDNLKLVEDTLDTLIKTCAQQLFDMTDDVDNAALAYVTHKDISRLQAFQQQTVLAVKAPEETKLEVPAPKEDSIQVHLKGGKGPIMVWTCDVGPEERSNCFLTLEESRIKTATLLTESSGPQSAVQSA